MDDKVDILVVDDLPEKLFALRGVLEDLGENLVMVGTGADALRELLRREFAVVLLDVNMPDIDGIETAELMRRHPKTAHTPIIFITAYADEMQTARGYALGAVDYIQAPVVPEILRSKVKVFVDLYRAKRRAAELARADAKREAAEEHASKLQEAGRRKDEFLAMLSHELRNPLAPIRNATEVLQHVVSTDPRVEWARDVIERQVAHMTQLVDDLLDVSRITQGKITLRKQPVNLGHVVKHAIETSQALLDSKRQRLSVEWTDAPAWVCGDFARLSQVIGNLLHNAAKYTPESGSLELALAAHRDEVVVTVRDNGGGIDPDFLPHVFEPFTQGQATLDRSLGGLGVGLSVVRRLVELHDGRVEAYSRGLGHGAQFRVALPRIAAVERAPPSIDAPPASRTGAKRVLVVDDNVDAAETIAVLLRLNGHDVRLATDGTRALEVLPGFAPEVALLDIGLPGMDGYELAMRIAESAPAPILLIALTGYGQSTDLERSRDAGFHHHFVKPGDPRAIEAIIAGWSAEAGGSEDPGDARGESNKPIPLALARRRRSVSNG